MLNKYLQAVIEDVLFDKNVPNRSKQGISKIFINPTKDEWNNEFAPSTTGARGVATVNGDIILMPGQYYTTHEQIVGYLQSHLNELKESDRPFLTKNDYVEIEQNGRTTGFRIGATFVHNFKNLPPNKQESERKRLSIIKDAVDKSSHPVKIMLTLEDTSKKEGTHESYSNNNKSDSWKK